MKMILWARDLSLSQRQNSVVALTTNTKVMSAMMSVVALTSRVMRRTQRAALRNPLVPQMNRVALTTVS
jgi:hypothetical protein